MTMYNPLLVKIKLAQKFGESIADSLFISYEEAEPRYKIEKDKITIYNFAYSDESGYFITDDFIELPPTNQSYNLIGIKSRKICVKKDVLLNPKTKQIIEDAIREALTETNQAAESSYVRILKDYSLLVTSDDWSNEIQ